jgi:hypothetical protein
MAERFPGDLEPAKRRREERMRYEVLDMLYRLSRGDPERPIDCAPVSEAIGDWRQELVRVIDFLVRVELARYCGMGPLVVCINGRGIAYLEGEAGRLKRIPDEP